MPPPIPAPILDLPPRWGYRREISIAAKSIRLGDGYTMLSSTGPRRFVEKASISSPAACEEDLVPIILTLRSLAGAMPFQWSPTGVDRKEYISEQWQITNAGAGFGRLTSVFDRWNGAAPLVQRSAIPPELDITLTWDTPFSDTAIVNERRVDDGVDRRSRLHLNPIQRSFPVRIVTDREAELDLFLLGLYGSPFRLGATHRKLGEGDWIFNCLSWSFEGLGNGYSRFEAEFNQFRTPQYA